MEKKVNTKNLYFLLYFFTDAHQVNTKTNATEKV